MALPFSKTLRVLDLKLSNEDFASIVDSDINSKGESSLLLDGCAYPADSFLAKIAYRVSRESTNCSDPLDEDWVLLTRAKNFKDGYFGAAYWNHKYQQVVIAHKGTKGLKDIWADYEGVLSGEYTSQMCSASTFSYCIAEKLITIIRNHSANFTLSLTGHSLGGWLAQVAAFSIQYLSPKLYEGVPYFVKRKDEGYHAHTVVFDCPGCKKMLLTMENDFNIHYDGKINLSFLLDVTIYLSAPNLVNTLHSHLNVNNLYRVFIKDLPEKRRKLKLIQYTNETHKMKQIRDVFFSNENYVKEKIMKVMDWPLVKGGLGARILDKLFNSSQNEYEHFHKLANCDNKYDPPTDGDEYCTLRYQVKSVEKGVCGANILTQSEFDFLDGCQWLKQFSMLSIADDLLLSIDKMTNGRIKKDKVEELLHGFEIKEGEGRGVIKCESEEKLRKLVTCVKNILFVFPNIDTEIKINVFNAVYKNQTRQYLETIDYIELKMASMEFLVDFLKDLNWSFLQLTCKMHPMIEIKKIHKFLNETKTSFTTFFLNMKQLGNLEEIFALNKFVKQSRKDVSMLFVIENVHEIGKKEKKLQINYFNKLFRALKEKPKLKFILVSRESIDLELCLDDDDKFYCEIKDDSEILLNDLTSNSEEHVLERKIFFQGEEISLHSLITKDSKHLIDEETLYKLVSNERIDIGEKLPDLGDIKSYYIDRCFNHHVRIQRDIEKDSRIFVTHADKFKNSELNPSQDIVLISEGGESFDKLCNECKNYNIHWLKEEFLQFIWLNSRGNLSRLREYLDTDNVAEYHDVNGRIVIISAVSGAGKSTVLTELALNMKQFNPSFWVVRVNLNDHTEKLANQDFSNNKGKILKFIMDIASINTPLEKELLKHRLNISGKVALLFDGFDEIVPKYKGKVFKLLKYLKYSKAEKLWITTRPHMQNGLEDALSVVSHTLRPLSKEDQVMFLERYMCQIKGVHFKKHFKNFAKRLIDHVSEPISDQINEFTGIPLHLKMLVEAFQDEFNYEKENYASEKLNLVNLYSIFVDKKYNRHLKEKDILNQTKPGVEYETLYDSFMKKYSLLALSTLFCEEDLNKFLFKGELSDIKNYIQQVEEGRENSGFVSRIVGVKPIFIHISFTEYFAALFFSNNLERIEVKKFFCDQVYLKEHDLISFFFDQMAANDINHCEVHIAVLNNDKNKVTILLSNADKVKNINNVTDRLGRTALHLAAAYGYFDITNTLLNHSFSANAEDQLLGWKPLRFADRKGHWDIAEILLRNSASSDDLIEAAKSLKIKDYFEPKKFLLHEAAEKSFINILRALIKNSEGLINAVDETESFPLHYAATKEVAELLIKCGANIEAKGYYDKTPIFSADNKELVEFLIAQGANINAKAIDGHTALHCSILSGRDEITELLVRHGADINAKSFNIGTPLHWAAYYERDKIVELLVREGADIEARDYLECTPLFHAKSKRVFDLLIEKGADIKARMYDGNTPLHWAALNERDEIVELLIREGADINAKMSDGDTILKWAAVYNRDLIVQLLVSKSDDVAA